MESFRKFSKKLATLALAFTMLFGTSVTAFAATTDQSSYEVRTYKNGYYYTGTEYGAPITVNLDVAGDKIVNLKSSSANLRVYCVSTRRYSKTAKIGVWSKKPGKYTVTFDVADAAGKVKEHKAVTVKVYIDKTTTSPVKKITYAGKDLWSENFYDAVSIPKSGKLKVKMNKNYTLTGLRIEKKGKDGNYTYTSAKNGKKIKLGTIADSYKSDPSSSKQYSREDMAAYTYVEVSYKNKKTGETGKITYGSLTKLVNYVK